ncbi:MAG: MerR family transcriptional regulator [Firmicutes bacterium]|nr:MerR family transcriptional regulator [Bacillota bacterium]
MKKIKDVSEITGLTKRTLQYYDEQGLVKPKRTEENYRVYGKEELQKIWKLLIYKEMGFLLDEIAQLLTQPEDETRWILEERLVEIEEKIDDLLRVHRFSEKILEDGIPDVDSVKRMIPDGNYCTMAETLAEKPQPPSYLLPSRKRDRLE